MSSIQFITKPGFQERLFKACASAHILITLQEIKDCDDSDTNKMVMTCVSKGISMAWILFGKGNIWFMDNNWWELFGQPLNFDFASKN